MPHRQKKDDIDFEIKFYEGVLKKKGDFLQALIALGDLYTRKGEHQKGLEVDLKLAHLKPDDPLVYYNLACSYSLLGDIDKSYKAVKQAVKFGYRDLRYMEADKDLVNLFKDTRFQKYFARLKKNQFKTKKPLP